MNQAWVFVWLAGEPAHAAQQEQLQAWAASKEVELTAPLREGRSSADPEPEVMGATAAHIERLTERARVAADSLDTSMAAELVAEAQGELTAHPELPQAPWLLAEVSRLAAELAASAGDTERAAAHSRAASLLEGPRSPDVSTTMAASSELDTRAPVTASTPREFLVSGLRPGDRLYWNGSVLALGPQPPANAQDPPGGPKDFGARDSIARDSSARGSSEQDSNEQPRGGRHLVAMQAPEVDPQGRWRIPLEPGLHHARVLRGGRAVWAGWIDVPAAPGQIELPVPAPIPCSLDDFQSVSSPGGLDTPITCDRWVAVRPAAPAGAQGADAQGAGAQGTATSIEVAWCHRDQCGPFERWPRAAVPEGVLAATPPDEAGGVPWWGYALLGTAVSATAAILFLSVTNRDRQERPVWIYGGVQ